MVFTATLNREWVTSSVLDENVFVPAMKGTLKWLTKDCPPTDGVYVGWRTVYNGTYHRGTGSFAGGDPPELRDRKGITHALVAVHQRSALVRVPWTHLRVKGKWLGPFTTEELEARRGVDQIAILASGARKILGREGAARLATALDPNGPLNEFIQVLCAGEDPLP